MLKALFSNRLFIGALVFFVLTVGGSLLYLKHVKRETQREIKRAQEIVKRQEELPIGTAKTRISDDTQQPLVVDTEPQGGHWHADETAQTADILRQAYQLTYPTPRPPEVQAVVDAMYKRLAQEDPELYADSKAIDDAYEELFAEQQKIHNDMLSDNADWAEIRAARRKLKEKHRQARALIDNFRAKYVSP